MKYPLECYTNSLSQVQVPILITRTMQSKTHKKKMSLNIKFDVLFFKINVPFQYYRKKYIYLILSENLSWGFY